MAAIVVLPAPDTPMTTITDGSFRCGSEDMVTWIISIIGVPSSGQFATRTGRQKVLGSNVAHADIPTNSLLIGDTPQIKECRVSIASPAAGRRRNRRQIVPHGGDGRKPINAKCESVATLPTFRDAYRLRRCILPVDGSTSGKRSRGSG
jgi:hypothetical protein